MARLFLLLFLGVGILFGIDFSFEGVKKSKELRYDYGVLKYNKQKFFGEYKRTSYTFKTKMETKQRFAKMAQQIKATLKDPSLSFDSSGYARFTKKDNDYILHLETYNKSAKLEQLKVAPYKNFLSLGMQEWPLKSSAKKRDVPILKIAPISKELQVSRLKYKNYEEKKFRAKKKVFSAKGHYWLIEYKLKKRDKKDLLRYRATHNYKKLLEDLGAQIVMKDDQSFIFSLYYQERHYVGRFEAYDYSFKIEAIEEEAFKQSLVLSPDKLKAELDAKGKVTLRGIYFDTDKATLKKESEKAITAAATLMKRYKDLVLEVQGHTDSQGDDAYNMSLSKRRAAAVVDALVKEGIEKKRLRSKGFGETRPVADNSTPEGRAKNRRVELHKVSGGDALSEVSIDFIKPLPNAHLDAEYHYKNDKFTIFFTPPYKKKTLSKTALSHDVRSYVIIRDKKVDKSFSKTEILANYKNTLPMLGAKIVGERKNTLYFMLEGKSKKCPLYGSIDAYNARYNVHFYTLCPSN